METEAKLESEVIRALHAKEKRSDLPDAWRWMAWQWYAAASSEQKGFRRRRGPCVRLWMLVPNNPFSVPILPTLLRFQLFNSLAQSSMSMQKWRNITAAARVLKQLMDSTTKVQNYFVSLHSSAVATLPWFSGCQLRTYALSVFLFFLNSFIF